VSEICGIQVLEALHTNPCRNERDIQEKSLIQCPKLTKPYSFNSLPIYVFRIRTKNVHPKKMRIGQIHGFS